MAEKRGEEKVRRLFYKTTIHYTVLSEDPIDPHFGLADIAREAYEGRYVGYLRGESDEVLLNGAAMAGELLDAGSDPGFFELDAEGNDHDENEMPYDFEGEPFDKAVSRHRVITGRPLACGSCGEADRTKGEHGLGRCVTFRHK